MRIHTRNAILRRREDAPLPLVDPDQCDGFGKGQSMRKSFNESMKRARGRYGAPRMHT